MKKLMTTQQGILQAIKKVLSNRRCFWTFFLFSFGIFTLLYMIPVWTTPGNDIAFHFSLLPKSILFVMILLSFANGLLLTMQMYVRGQKKRIKDVAKESVTLLGIIGSTFVATIACAACYSSVLALFGLGASAFVVKYQFHFILVAIALTLIALHYTSKRVLGDCDVCQIKLS